MKKIFVSAYSAQNLGDDLFLKILSQRYPKQRFVFFADRKYKKYGFKNIRVYNLLYTLRKKLIIAEFSDKKGFFSKYFKYFLSILVSAIDKISGRIKYSAQIKIAGSVFQQPIDWNPEEGTAYIFDGRKLPSFVINSNFGPFTHQKFVDVHRTAFSYCKSVSFRDTYSYSLFSDLKNVFHAPDVVFAGKYGIEPSNDLNNIIVSVIDLSRKEIIKQYVQEYEAKLAEICIRFASLGNTVTLMSFCKFEGDEDAIDKIKALLPSDAMKNIDEYRYCGNINEALQLIADSRFVVATRFHSMILGWYFNKNIFPVIYGEKMEHYLDDVKFSGKTCMVKDIGRLDVNDVMYNFENNVEIDTKSQREGAEKHFAILDDFINIQ